MATAILAQEETVLNPRTLGTNRAPEIILRIGLNGITEAFIFAEESADEDRLREGLIVISQALKMSVSFPQEGSRP